MPRYTPEQEHQRDLTDRKILELRDQGKSQSAIALALGCTRGRIVRLLREVDVDLAKERETA